MLSAMQFRSFVWPINPHMYEVEYRRTLHSYKLPFGGYVVQNLGLQNRIFRGEGEFTGPAAYEKFRELAALFEDNKGGKLVHPIWPEVWAYFAKLSLKEEPREDCVSYTFEFWEYKPSRFELISDSMDDINYHDRFEIFPNKKKYVSAEEGDTLALIAGKCSITVEAIMALNASIEDPYAALETGYLVRIS